MILDPHKLLQELTDLFHVQGYSRAVAQRKAEALLHKCSRWKRAA